MSAHYPTQRAARDRFVLERRGPRPDVDLWTPPRVLVDAEPDGRGGVVEVATVFLTTRECPWRCVMCDLWRYAIPGDTPAGAVPWQIARALADLQGRSLPSQLKLYNAGSLFDAHAVPPGDDEAIARAVAPFTRVIVESHPRLIGARTWRFRERLAVQLDGAGPSLEVAMGLETAHPAALDRLHKGFTVDEFANAAAALAGHDVALRVFLLVHPPFIPRDEQDAWLARSVDVSLACRASVISVIPTRGGNGAMEALAALGEFQRPSLTDFEAAAALAVQRARGRARVLADPWDLAAFATCHACFEPRRRRLETLNLTQRVPPPVSCATCGATTPA